MFGRVRERSWLYANFMRRHENLSCVPWCLSLFSFSDIFSSSTYSLPVEMEDIPSEEFFPRLASFSDLCLSSGNDLIHVKKEKRKEQRQSAACDQKKGRTSVRITAVRLSITFFTDAFPMKTLRTCFLVDALSVPAGGGSKR